MRSSARTPSLPSHRRNRPMRRIAISLLLLTFAAPVAAQDWERVFTEGAPEPAFKVLMLDPSEPRESRDRYKLAPLGSVGLSAWATARRDRALPPAGADRARVEPAAVHRAVHPAVRRPVRRGGRVVRWRRRSGRAAVRFSAPVGRPRVGRAARHGPGRGRRARAGAMMDIPQAIYDRTARCEACLFAQPHADRR